ncbi:response regulator [Methanosarcina sp. KYL-1]|uniref:response regulator n=1 Tax=Methanosarcina sp. KYL-1 TaxID=2602068 RepID=UPI002100759D
MKKILLVDDNEDLIELLKEVLADFDVEDANNGVKAVEKFRKQNPDIVLMDIMMPEMDGIEATREIVGINPGAKIVGLTAYGSCRGDQMLSAGACRVLSKPVKYTELLQCITDVLSQGQPCP